jgi:hypothetical protein
MEQKKRSKSPHLQRADRLADEEELLLELVPRLGARRGVERRGVALARRALRAHLGVVPAGDLSPDAQCDAAHRRAAILHAHRALQLRERLQRDDAVER